MEDDINTMSNETIVTKICYVCKKELPITEFAKRRYRSSKADAHYIYSSYGKCKKCTSTSKAIWRLLHPNYMKLWYIKHKQLKIAKNAI